MLLSNFNCVFNTNSYSGGNYLKRMDGTMIANSNIYSSYFSTTNQTSHYCGNGAYTASVLIGGGDTAVTKDDYDMDLGIVGNDKMTSLIQAATYSKVGGVNVTTHWKNNSASPITVKELGLIYKYTTTVSSKEACILLARKALSIPLVVQPGETYAFSYNIKI